MKKNTEISTQEWNIDDPYPVREHHKPVGTESLDDLLAAANNVPPPRLFSPAWDCSRWPQPFKFVGLCFSYPIGILFLVLGGIFYMAMSSNKKSSADDDLFSTKMPYEDETNPLSPLSPLHRDHFIDW